ncbi:MAG: type II toxin-antitoxin system VapC family toxin [Chloroflexi bacterium]|nr:type II toxin-antitoxin system VapC family toxin [Chloroflexota bacterium]
MIPDNAIYILDSYAVMSYLGDEPGRARLEELLSKAKAEHCTLLLCMINFGEILYMTERRRGLVKAQSVQGLLESFPIEFIEASRNLILDAAHIRANYALSYAGAFVVALAQHEGGIILTGDPEFETVEELVAVEWLEKKE